MGTPLERMFMMAEAMLDAMKQFKSPDGKSLRIRVGMLFLDSHIYTSSALLDAALDSMPWLHS